MSSVRLPVTLAILAALFGASLDASAQPAGTERVGAVATDRDTLADARFAVMPSQDDVVAREWYQPQVTIGLRNPRPWPRAIAPDAPTRFAAGRAVAAGYGTLALLVIQDGRIVLEEYAPGIAATTRFESNSMHRGLLALAVAAAVDAGRLPSYDATLGSLAPDWFGPQDARASIRVLDLLLGQGGLVDPVFANEAQSPGMQLFIGSDLRRIVLAAPTQAPPGTKYTGGIVEAQLLGLVLERQLGRVGYADWLERTIWKPLGAGRATLRLDREGGATRTFCCLQATAADWARVGQLVLDRGLGPPRSRRVAANDRSARAVEADRRRVLSERAIDRVLSPSPLNPAVGMYWFLKPTPLVPRSAGAAAVPQRVTPFTASDAVYAGARGGQRVYVIPSRRAVVVRFGAMRYDFDDGAFLNPFVTALDAR